MYAGAFLHTHAHARTYACTCSSVGQKALAWARIVSVIVLSVAPRAFLALGFIICRDGSYRLQRRLIRKNTCKIRYRI